MATTIEHSDHEEVVRAAIECRQVDADVSKRVRERALRVRDELRLRHGLLDVAVELIRQAREE